MSEKLPTQFLTLEAWAEATYGSAAPSAYTLRKWARERHITPMPEKHGRTYYVLPQARYVPYSTVNRLVNRIARSGKAA